MRKLLLATSALLGASVGIAGVASAGTLSPNANNPAPGSITVTLNALVEAFFVAGSDSGTSAAARAAGGGTKSQDYGIADYVRLYPSFDGALANGLKYGGSVEIRQNTGFQTPSSASVSSSSSGGVGGQGNSSNVGQVTLPGGQKATTYIQRGYVYLGADKFGKIYLGTPVQPTELFQTGNPANFNTGGWDGDLPGMFTTGLPYFIDDDNDQANKVVYVSPQFAGFDFGISFEPDNNGRDFAGGASRASSAPSTAVGTQYGKRRNTVDGAVRYQGTFGAIGLKADGGYSYGGTVTASDGTAANPIANFRNFSLAAGGVAVTFGGLEIDGHIDSGKYGVDLTPIKRGSTGTTAYVTGASYTIGPIIFGASYYGFDSGYTKTQFSSVGGPTGGSLHGYGIAAGGTYSLAPGANVFLEYLYGHQHASGVDLVNGGLGSANNNTRAQGFGLGTAFKW